MATIFNTTQSTAHRTIKPLLPRIANLLVVEPPLEPLLLLDGTLIPVHDHVKAACSKNYRRSVNLQIVTTLDKRVVHVGTAWPGNRNDIVVARDTLPDWGGVTYMTDGAYRSLPNAITPPPRSETEARDEHKRLRARIEHVIARLKDWQILRQCRRRGHGINHAARAVAYLYNLAREYRINS